MVAVGGFLIFILDEIRLGDKDFTTYIYVFLQLLLRYVTYFPFILCHAYFPKHVHRYLNLNLLWHVNHCNKLECYISILFV